MPFSRINDAQPPVGVGQWKFHDYGVAATASLFSSLYAAPGIGAAQVRPGLLLMLTDCQRGGRASSKDRKLMHCYTECFCLNSRHPNYSDFLPELLNEIGLTRRQ